jgi:hypothetical protein
MNTWELFWTHVALWGLKGLADASVSQFLSYLGEQVEAAPPDPVPTQWTKDGSDRCQIASD